MGVPCTATFAFLFLVLIFSLYFNFCRFTYNVSCCGLLWLVGESCSVVSNSLQPHRLYSPWNSPGQNTGVGSRSLLHEIFPTQGSNPGLLHCRRILYQLSHQESPRILEWVACPFSSRSSQPRNQIRVSCIAGGFFTSWASREAPDLGHLSVLSNSGI